MTSEQAEHLMSLAKDMRAKQKTYFRQRNPSALNEAKAAESELDKFIAKIEAEKEPNLFSGETK